jgi:hypothetical protein
LTAFWTMLRLEHGGATNHDPVPARRGGIGLGRNRTGGPNQGRGGSNDLLESHAHRLTPSCPA